MKTYMLSLPWILLSGLKSKKAWIRNSLRNVRLQPYKAQYLLTNCYVHESLYNCENAFNTILTTNSAIESGKI